MPIAILILLITLIIIALRHMVINVPVPIWAIMATGAIASILFKQISPLQAFTAIEPDIILYLLGIFLIAQAAEESGYLEYVTDKIFFHAHTGKQALFIIIFILGLSSALLMNDTIAIIGTPIILQLCRTNKELIKPLLFSLAFAITIGSTFSPIGNPQNLLIAVKSGMSSPFLSFIKTLMIPSLINLIIVYLIISYTYQYVLTQAIAKPLSPLINDLQTATLVKTSLIIMFILIITKIITDFSHLSFKINFSYITLISALPILLSKKRQRLLKKLDWGTLVFFISTFILMESVWNSGFFQESISYFNLPITKISIILVVSIILSQFISNVPLVALYLPLLLHQHLTESHLLALVVGSSIAGNLSILGAASNVIIIQGVEKRSAKAFGFFEFLKLGAFITLINVLVYACFL